MSQMFKSICKLYKYYFFLTKNVMLQFLLLYVSYFILLCTSITMKIIISYADFCNANNKSTNQPTNLNS